MNIITKFKRWAAIDRLISRGLSVKMKCQYKGYYWAKIASFPVIEARSYNELLDKIREFEKSNKGCVK